MNITGILLGIFLWIVIRFLIRGFYVVEQNERAVKIVFGRAKKFGDITTLHDQEFYNSLNEDERERYNYPQLRVILLL
jgi:regulator of protease activity HflC (stomatin/prohibitin superfamily)